MCSKLWFRIVCVQDTRVAKSGWQKSNGGLFLRTRTSLVQVLYLTEDIETHPIKVFRVVGAIELVKGFCAVGELKMRHL